MEKLRKRLNNNIEIPLLGLGTWQLQNVRNAATTALDLGYRHLDTAWIYENEEELGLALKETDVKREDLFITSKLWNNHHDHPERELKNTLKDLKLEYLDLYLIHWPVSFQGEYEPVKLWETMESFVRKDLVKSIGISNHGIKNTTIILDNCSIKPVVNQLEFHPYLQQKTLRTFLEDNNISMIAYSCLGSGVPNSVIKDELIVELATKYNCSPASIIINWVIKNDICVIPRSGSEIHLKENRKLVDLSPEDIKRINDIDKVQRYVNPESFGPCKFD